MLFPTHLQARELCLQTYSLSLPLEWSQVTHIPASIKSGGTYKPEKSAFYSTFTGQLCDDTHLPGWLSAFPVHSQTFKPTQASFVCTHKEPTLTFNELENLFSVCLFILKVLEDFFKVPPNHMKVPPKGRRPHQRDMPWLIPVAAMGM